MASYRTMVHRRPFPLAAACLAAACTAAAFMLLRGESSAASSLVPSLYMALVLLGGSGLAMASATGLAALAWALVGGDDALRAGAMAAVAVACGEALRRGVRPHYLFAAVFVACLVHGLRGLQFEPQLVSRALIESGANTALATAVFAVVPMRSRVFPARSRTRLDHILFVAIAGVAMLATLGTLAWPRAGNAADALLPLLSAVAVIALAVSATLALTGRNSLRRLLQKPDKRADSRARRFLPLELLQLRLAAARRHRELKHGFSKDRTELGKLRVVTKGLAEELRRARETLQKQGVELQRATASATRTRARFEALMEGITAAALFTAPDGTVRRANRAALTLLGHQPGSILGKPVSSLIPDEHILDHPLAGASAGRATSAGRVETCKVVALDGSRRELGVQVLQFEIGSQQHSLVLLREADAVKLAQAKLEQARSLARSVHQSRDMFIAMMSHELRTPLHGLIATLDMLRHGDAAGESRHQLAIARTSARTLLKVANDVLDFARIGSDQFTLDRRPFSLSRILREVVEEVEARAASLGLEVKSSVPDNLPPSFLGDAARLKQVLGNLVSNALKFTSRGGVKVNVAYDGKRCCIDVIDTGEGIPQDKRDGIFEPFVQAHSRSKSQAGTGLGLPISRRLAEAMGGKLVLLRSGSEGSTFRLTLALEASSELPPEDQSLRVFSNPRGRILVVEDNAANRYVAQALLTGLECPATIVDGGQQALDLLRQEEFDLVLMDCQMPGMDGYETTREARRILKKHVPIIAMTANAMADDRKDCLEAGMDDFLSKPFDRRALNEILCKWLAPARPADADADIGKGMAKLPDLDETVLDELYESLRWKTAPLRQIHSTFNESLKPMVPLLKVAGPADRARLQRHLHTILGSSGMVGARQVEFLAGQLRQAVEERRYDFLEKAAADLEGAMARYNREFERWIEKDRLEASARPGRLRVAGK